MIQFFALVWKFEAGGLKYVARNTALSAEDIVKEHGYPEFCKVFCTHDWYAFGVSKRHSRFIRKSTIAEDSTVCHDTIAKVK